jgi:TetR/AcrR family transcriptional regulator, transcriptional repressor for nem operon
MRKGERTRKEILDQASQVFSVRGYAGASMDDLTRAARLTKGGLYNHFESKEDLMLASFEHAMAQVRERFAGMASGLRDTRSRLMAVLRLYVSLLEDPVVQGGCPILYTAVEADDTHPELRRRAREKSDDWRDYIVRTLRKGIELGTVNSKTDPVEFADLMLAALEGGVVLSKLYGDLTPMRRVVGHLTSTIDGLLISQENT